MTVHIHNQCLREEEIVDLILQPNDPTHSWQKRHIEQCQSCHAHYEQWSEWLREPEEDDVPLLPSPALANAIRQKTRPRFRFRQLVVPQAKPTWVFAMLTTAVMIVAIVGTLSTPITLHTPIAQGETVEKQQFLLDPQTRPVKTETRTTEHIVSVTHDQESVPLNDRVHNQERHPLNGNVWVNHSTGELLVAIRGVHPSADQDYQAWLVDQHRPVTIGVLQVQNGNAHIYVHKPDLDNYQQLWISVEPKGGSRTPTGPEALVVPVTHTAR